MSNPLENLSFLTLFDALAEAVLLIDDSGVVVAANSSAQTMLAYTEKAIIGLSVEQLMPKDYRHHHAGARKQYLKKPEKRSMGDGQNLIALTKAGESLPVDISLSPVKVGEKHYVLTSLHPIDKQIAAETSLKLSQERLLFAKKSTEFGVFDIHLHQQTVLYDALIGQLFGFDEDAVIDYPAFLKRINVVDQVRWESVLENASSLENDNEFQIELRIRNAKNGLQHWLQVAVKVFFKNDLAVSMLGIAQDITEGKLLQQKLNKQRIELDALSKTQVAIQTASAIAHEINQPLTAISAYSEVALYALKAESLDEERLSRSLLGCVEQAQRAGNSLHELMQFLHKGKVERAPVSLNQVVSEAVDMVQHYGYGEFHPTLDLEPGLPEVLANATQLQKVLVNLLSNGVEAVKSTGIPIAKISVKVRTHAHLNMGEVVIKDNGPGLTAEVAQRIFEPFFTTKPNGVGMGLGISRSLVEASGGKLWFDANSRDGAVFHLTLPFVS